ncbi:putative proline rich membrane-anchored mycosin MycP5 [Mycobacterium xenopi 4042]|uniref:Putative proline rich membrane-anchored mycosin MycP5 n=1 Tax=Mycobacterium xenopi 4042 TaxID=1299334 RepID=X7ZZ97_MYCXE|nr:putative proline rich membrane-anchored mycosin MycP5 [Mycobacterium xenopi 4042]
MHSLPVLPPRPLPRRCARRPPSGLPPQRGVVDGADSFHARHHRNVDNLGAQVGGVNNARAIARRSIAVRLALGLRWPVRGLQVEVFRGLPDADQGGVGGHSDESIGAARAAAMIPRPVCRARRSHAALGRFQ